MRYRTVKIMAVPSSAKTNTKKMQILKKPKYTMKIRVGTLNNDSERKLTHQCPQQTLTAHLQAPGRQRHRSWQHPTEEHNTCSGGAHNVMGEMPWHNQERHIRLLVCAKGKEDPESRWGSGESRGANEMHDECQELAEQIPPSSSCCCLCKAAPESTPGSTGWARQPLSPCLPGAGNDPVARHVSFRHQCKEVPVAPWKAPFSDLGSSARQLILCSPSA